VRLRVRRYLSRSAFTVSDGFAVRTSRTIRCFRSTCQANARTASNSNYEKPNKSSWYLWGMLGFRQRSRESINIGSDRCSLQAGVNMILRLCESTGEALGDFAGEMRRYAGQADRQKYAVLNA
jgi:hypothetical protein